MANKPLDEQVEYEVEQTIGQTIGVVQHTFSIELNNGSKGVATINIDFSLATDTDINTWLCSNRTISGQRAWRKMTFEEFMSIVHGQTFQATAIGQKVKTRAEKITTYTSMGLPLDLAEIAVDDPVRFQNIMDKANVGNSDK